MKQVDFILGAILQKEIVLSNFLKSQCSHNMPQRYYQDSAHNRDDSTNFVSKRCDSYKKFEEDDCYGDTLQMGEALDVENAVEGRYYLDTKSYQDDDSGTLYSYSKT